MERAPVEPDPPELDPDFKLAVEPAVDEGGGGRFFRPAFWLGGGGILEGRVANPTERGLKSNTV